MWCAQAFSLVPDYLRTRGGHARRTQPDGYRHSARPPLPVAEALDDPSAFWRGAAARRAVASTCVWRRCSRRAWMSIRISSALAPVPFAVVCFRARPRGLLARAARARSRSTSAARRRQRAAATCFSRIHASMAAFAMRMAIGHLRTTAEHTGRAWQLLARTYGRARAYAPVRVMTSSIAAIVSPQLSGVHGHFACTVAAGAQRTWRTVRLHGARPGGTQC